MSFRRLSFAGRESGFTVVSVLVGLTILSLSLISLIPLYVLSAKIAGNSNAKLIATNLANQQLEKVRSLAYDNVGTVAGNPTGTLSADFDKTTDGISFRIKTRVSWVDGDFDGTYPSDSDPRDYKKVIVTVSWSGSLPSDKDVQLSTLVSRESEEKVVVGGNIEAVAKDTQNNLLEDVKIEITAGPSSPMSDSTDSTGRTIFYLLTPSETDGDYTVNASKDDWIVRPGDQNQTCTVIVNETRSLEFVLGQPGTLIVHFKDPAGQLVDKNSKLTLVSTEAGTEEYTSHDGNFTVTGLFPGSYDLTAWAASYHENGPIQIDVLPNDTTEIDVTLVPIPTGGLHLNVSDQATSDPIEEAQVRVTNKTTGNEVIDTTNTEGIYENHFEAGYYTLEVGKSGYDLSIQDIYITASGNTNVDVQLQSAPLYGSILVRAEYRSTEDPRDNVRIRVVGSGYDEEARTGIYAPGEALFDNLEPGPYTVWRRSGSRWRYAEDVTVTAGGRERVLYSY